MMGRLFLLFALVLFSASLVTCTIFGWGSSSRLGTASRTYDMIDFLNRAIAAGTSARPTGTIIKTLLCNREFLILTDAGYVYTVGRPEDTPQTYRAFLKLDVNYFDSTSDNDLAVDIACTTNFDVAAKFVITARGRLFSWGNDGTDITPQLGAYRTSWTAPYPVEIPQGSAVVKISASYSTTFALLSDGTFIPFGSCASWCLMNTAIADYPNFANQNLPAARGISGQSIVDLAVYHSKSNPNIGHSVFCTASGAVYTAGEAGTSDVLMRAGASSTDVPVVVTFPSTLLCKKVIAGNGFSMVLMRDGSVWSSGAGAVAGGYSGGPPGRLTFPVASGSPPFIARDIFALSPDLPTTGIIAVGSIGPNQTMYGWGTSYAVSLWVPDEEGRVDVPSPRVLSYIEQDISSGVTFCSSARNISFCNLPAGKAILWTAEEIDFTATFGTPSFSNRTLPSRGDIRNKLSGLAEITALYDSGPSKYGFLIAQDANVQNRLGFLATGLTRTKSSIMQKENTVFRKVFPTDMAGFTIVLSTSDKVYACYWNNNINEFTMFEEVSAFSSTPVLDIVAFSRPLNGQWINFDALDGGDTYIGYLALDTSKRLWWTKRAPIPEWDSAGTSSQLNEILPSTLFGGVSPTPTIEKIYGKYDTFYLVDSNGDTWAFGENVNGQICGVAAGATRVTQAVKITPGKRWKWIFPLVKYVEPLTYTSDIALSNPILPLDAARSTVFVSETEVVACGDSAIWAPLTTSVSRANATNVIVDASFSLMTGIIRLQDASLWTIGAPDHLTWTRYDQVGLLKSRTLKPFVALAAGGGAVSSQIILDGDQKRSLIQNIFDLPGGGSVTLFGSGLGETGDGETVTASYSVNNDNLVVPCLVVSRQSTRMTIVPTPEARIFTNVVFPAPGTVTFRVDFGGSEFRTTVPVVSNPYLDPPELYVPRIAQNADALSVYGNDLSGYMSLELSPGGRCRTLYKNETVITCVFGDERLLGIVPGVNLVVRATSPDLSDDDSRVSDRFTLQVVSAPKVTEGSASIPPSTAVLTIVGEGFDETGMTTEATVRQNTDPIQPCGVESPTATAIVCRLSTPIGIEGATISVQVRSFGGWSPVTVIGSIPRQAVGSGINAPLIGGLVGGIGGALLIAVILIVVLLLRRKKKKGLAPTVDVPAEMAGMFNIKSSDLEIVKKLGEGSFGAVFLCKYKGKMVALKKLLGSMMDAHVNDFFREAALMTGIPPHKNIVKIYGLCQEQNNFSLAMEFLRNGSLDTYLQRRVFFDPDEGQWDKHILHRICVGVARGMAHLSSQGVVHRDLAARNVLLGNHCEPKVSDFGMSRMVGGDDKKGKTNSTVGPIKWMPPESLSAQEYSEKSDVWAYGVTLYEITTGREPFENEDFIKIVLEVRDQGRNVLTDMSKKDKAKIPDYILEVMEKCFAVDAAERPTFVEIEKMLMKGAPFGYTEANDEEESASSESSKSGDDNKDNKNGNYTNATALGGGAASAGKLLTNKKKSGKKYDNASAMNAPSNETKKDKKQKKKSSADLAVRDQEDKQQAPDTVIEVTAPIQDESSSSGSDDEDSSAVKMKSNKKGKKRASSSSDSS